MICTISCYDPETKLMGRFFVPHAVYVYIKQLENGIKHPRKSLIKERYPFRFKRIVQNNRQLHISK